MSTAIDDRSRLTPAAVRVIRVWRKANAFSSIRPIAETGGSVPE
jgi:hypothetical protein